MRTSHRTPSRAGRRTRPAGQAATAWSPGHPASLKRRILDRLACLMRPETVPCRFGSARRGKATRRSQPVWLLCWVDQEIVYLGQEAKSLAPVRFPEFYDRTATRRHRKTERLPVKADLQKLGRPGVFTRDPWSKLHHAYVFR
jgi:hypothetical protein